MTVTYNEKKVVRVDHNQKQGNVDDFEFKKQQTVKRIKDKVLQLDERDSKVWEYITDVPRTNAPIQYILFLLNLVIPGTYLSIYNPLGSGTMIISCFTEKWSKTLFMVGLFQLFLAYILIGWLFSIYWGYLIVKKSFENQSELDNFLG